MRLFSRGSVNFLLTVVALLIAKAVFEPSETPWLEPAGLLSLVPLWTTMWSILWSIVWSTMGDSMGSFMGVLRGVLGCF